MANKVKILFLFMLILGSCEDGYITNCDECMPEPTVDVTLKIILRGDEYVPETFVVTIYEGPIENGLILTKVYVADYYYEYPAMIYKDYTIAVEYSINGKKYIAVDEVRPKIRHDESSCDEPCYYVYDNIVDLRLKYTGK